MIQAYFKRYGILGKEIIPLFLFLSIFLCLIIRAWPTTWDDSGITLAFSKNLAIFSNFIPSPRSSRVEGYSSFLWMVSNAGFFKLGFNENSVLFVAKATSTLFAITNIILFWQIVRVTIKTYFYQVIAILLYSINSYTIASAVDGMETALYAFLVLISFLLWKKRTSNIGAYIGFVLASSLLILIRHEGALFLIPFGLALLIEKRWKILQDPIIYIWATVFFTYHIWHYLIFGELLTNPMLAKRHWPYHPGFQNISVIIVYYLTPIIDFAFRYIFFFFTIPIFFFQSKFTHLQPPKLKNNSLIVFIALMAILVMCITGANWGAAARLSYPGLSFIILVLMSFLDDHNRFAFNKLSLFTALIGLTMNLLIIFQTVTVFTPDIITLAGVERRASTFDEMQTILKQKIITIAAVDMGGLLLYHDKGKNIIDLGMLVDKELAKNGYSNLVEYLFEQNKPEMIEAHGMWLDPLNKTREFSQMYTPIMVLTNRNEQILYLRNDIVSELKTKYKMTFATVKSGFSDIDQLTLKSLGTFLVLDLR